MAQVSEQVVELAGDILASERIAKVLVTGVPKKPEGVMNKAIETATAFEIASGEYAELVTRFARKMVIAQSYRIVMTGFDVPPANIVQAAFDKAEQFVELFSAGTDVDSNKLKSEQDAAKTASEQRAEQEAAAKEETAKEAEEVEAARKAASEAEQQEAQQAAEAEASKPDEVRDDAEKLLRETSISELDIHGRAKAAYQKAGIETVGHALDFKKAKGSLEAVPGVGDDWAADTEAEIDKLRDGLLAS